jgi:hypothetical protein
MSGAFLSSSGAKSASSIFSATGALQADYLCEINGKKVTWAVVLVFTLITELLRFEGQYAFEGNVFFLCGARDHQRYRFQAIKDSVQYCVSHA